MFTKIQPPGTENSSGRDDSRYFLRPMRARRKGVLVSHPTTFDSLEALLLADPAPSAIVVENRGGESQAAWLAPELPGPVVLDGKKTPLHGSLRDLLLTYSVPAASPESYLNDDMLLVNGVLAVDAHRKADETNRRGSELARRAGFAFSRVNGGSRIDIGLIGLLSAISLVVGTGGGLLPPVFIAAIAIGYLMTEIVVGVLRIASVRALTRDSVREAVFLRVPLSYVLVLLPVSLMVVSSPTAVVAGLGIGVVGWRVFDSVYRARTGAVLLGVDGGPVWPFLGRHWAEEERTVVRK